MMSRSVLTHSEEGVKEARREVARVRATRIGPRDPTQATTRRADKSSTARVLVGIWSLEAWVSGLGDLVDALNMAQSAFVFFEIDAVVPAGLISRPERVTAWFKEVTGRKPGKAIREHLEDNLIANDFFGLAEKIRADLHLDYMIGVTPSMVAFAEGNQANWNYFATFEGRALLVSTFQLYEFARDTGCPLEAFLGGIIVSQLLVAVTWPKLGFHDDSGCLFDFCESRVSLRDKVEDLHIDQTCLEKIDPTYRPAALSFVEMLRSYRAAK